jgi:hypothetical protein
VLGGCGGSSSSSSHSSATSAGSSASGAAKKACAGVETGLAKANRDLHNRANANTLKSDLRQVQHAFDALRPSIGSDVRGTFNLAEAEYTTSVQSLIYQQSGRAQDAQKQARLAVLLRQRLNSSHQDPFGVCRGATLTR